MIPSWFLSLCASQLLPRWCSGKNLPANAGDVGDSPWPKVQSLGQSLGSILGSGRSPGGQHGYTVFQYSCLENSVDRGVWWATVQRVTKSHIQLSDWALTDWLISQSADTKKTATTWGEWSPQDIVWLSMNPSPWQGENLLLQRAAKHESQWCPPGDLALK